MKTASYLRHHHGLAREWFCVLAPAAAWSFMLLTNAFLGEGGACSPGSIKFLTTPSAVKLAMAAVNSLAVVVCAACLLAAGRAWRRLRRSDSTPGGRAHWMSLVGVMASALFLLINLAAFLPLVFLHPPCAQSV